MTTIPAAVLLAAVATALAVPVLGWSLFARPGTATVLARDNLARDLDRTGPVAVRSGPGLLARLAEGLTPSGTVARLNRLAGTAGRPTEWPVPRLVAAKLVLALIAAVLGLLVVSGGPSPLTVLMAVAVTLVCYFLPELLLHSRAQERSQKITLELADTLDQMTIAVEAGLGFDGAMAKAGQNGQGPLAEELVRTLQDIQLGQSRREAYESLAGRTDVVDLRRFVRAVVQADKYGVAVADVLRTQAAEMRMKRRQRAEEKAMQIPVKVIFPLMLCILPVLFIVLLGPAAMDIVGAFS